MWFLDAALGAFRWYRRRRGGHWECWWIECCTACLWLPMDACYEVTGTRPVSAMGTPVCEDWPR